MNREQLEHELARLTLPPTLRHQILTRARIGGHVDDGDPTDFALRIETVDRFKIAGIPAEIGVDPVRYAIYLDRRTLAWTVGPWTLAYQIRHAFATSAPRAVLDHIRIDDIAVDDVTLTAARNLNTAHVPERTRT